MSHFYADIKGTRGPASRQGDKKNGMYSHTRGWDIGVEVRCFHDDETGKDHIVVVRTGGSNGGGYEKIVELVEGEPTWPNPVKEAMQKAWGELARAEEEPKEEPKEEWEPLVGKPVLDLPGPDYL